jgi:hypothetical protein
VDNCQFQFLTFNCQLGYFKTLDKPTVLVKELVKNQWLFYFIFHDNHGYKSENCFFKNKCGEMIRNPKKCLDNRWGFDGAISNTRPTLDQTLYRLILVIMK